MGRARLQFALAPALWFLLGTALASGDSRAANAPAPAAPKDADEIERALEKEKAASAQLGVKESSILGRLADLERQVELEGRSLRAAQAKLRVSQTHLAAAFESEQKAQAEVDEGMAALGPRLTARYQLGREGYVRFLLGARSVGDLLRRKRLYSALLQGDLDALADLRVKALLAASATKDLATARDDLAKSASEEQERRSALELRAAMQKRALNAVQQEKGAHDQAARELEEAAHALAARLQAIEKESRAASIASFPKSGTPVVSRDTQASSGNTAISSSNTTTSSGNTSIVPGNTSISYGNTTSASRNTSTVAADDALHTPANGAAKESSPAGSASAVASNGATGSSAGENERGVPGKKIAMVAPPAATIPAIRSQRGKLLFPVPVGHIEVRFGRTIDPRFGTVTLQRGLDIRAPEGTEVHAVYSGTVVHAGWFSGYGNLVILDHGDGLFSLFAHLATLAHAVGDAVDRGESLGTVGDTGSLKGAYLYFELRDGQKPLDPEKWLSKNRKLPALATHK